MNPTFLVITSIANSDNPVLRQFAEEAIRHHVPFIVIGDTKNSVGFNLEGCDFYSIERQQGLVFKLAKALPVNHYARKNIGYLLAMAEGAEVIIETDDDNVPLPDFWNKRNRTTDAHLLMDRDWVNIYKYFTDVHVWPRGFSLENIKEGVPQLLETVSAESPIQQGLVDKNPDVDAIYRLSFPVDITFNTAENIALGNNSICPFNSQNTTWFKEAFLLMYLPSYCNFRVTDIWRSFIAQRIAWTCGWTILFHNSTVFHERNDHNLMNDLEDEIPGYINNGKLYESLKALKLKEGVEHISVNLITCYQKLIDMGLIAGAEMRLLKNWIHDVKKIKNSEK